MVELRGLVGRYFAAVEKNERATMAAIRDGTDESSAASLEAAGEEHRATEALRAAHAAAEQEHDEALECLARVRAELDERSHPGECRAGLHEDCGYANGVWQCEGEHATEATTREECVAAEVAECNCGLGSLRALVEARRERKRAPASPPPKAVAPLATEQNAVRYDAIIEANRRASERLYIPQRLLKAPQREPVSEPPAPPPTFDVPGRVR